MGLTINYAWDASVASAPAGFKTALAQVAQYFGAMIADNISVTIEVGYGTIGSAAGGDYQKVSDWSALGGPQGGQYITYAQLKTLLAASKSSADDASVLASLGSVDPTGGAMIYLTAAQCKAVGLSTSSPYDGEVGFGAGATRYDFNVNDRANPAGWDFFGVAMHEITHALGRLDYLGSGSYTLMDLLRYQGAGARQFVDGQAAYFSIDGGVTKLADFATTSDTGDWAASAGTDCNSAFSSGAPNNFGAMDARELDALGFTLANFTAAGAISAHAAALPDNWMPVADTGANLSANLASLQTLFQSGNIARLSQTDATTGSISMTAAQYSADAAMLATLAGSYSLTIATTGAINITLGANELNLTLTGSGAGNLTGNGLNNMLVGGLGRDTLSGGAGNDTLVGGDGFALTAAQKSVYRLYGATLSREPDAAGFAAWNAQLAAGASLVSITAGFVNSSEFQSKYGTLNNSQFVTLLYNNVLHRAADAAGLNSWVAQLTGGASRSAIVDGFSESAENQGLTDMNARVYAMQSTNGAIPGEIYRLYGAAFNRAPDAAGFEAWTAAIAGGQTLASTAAAFAGSAEFKSLYGTLGNTQFVTQLYSNVLHRAADAAGLAAWTNLLGAGTSRATVLTGFSESAEYQASTASAIQPFIKSTITDWADLLDGGAGDDVLMGGRGADTFRFDRLAAGSDQIYGFESIDTLNLVNFGYANAAAATSHMAQSGADVVFADQGETITFRNTALATVTGSSFTFT